MCVCVCVCVVCVRKVLLNIRSLYLNKPSFDPEHTTILFAHYYFSHIVLWVWYIFVRLHWLISFCISLHIFNYLCIHKKNVHQVMLYLCDLVILYAV